MLSGKGCAIPCQADEEEGDQRSFASLRMTIFCTPPYGNSKNLPFGSATPAAPVPGLGAEPGLPCGWPAAS